MVISKYLWIQAYNQIVILMCEICLACGKINLIGIMSKFSLTCCYKHKQIKEGLTVNKSFLASAQKHNQTIKAKKLLLMC